MIRGTLNHVELYVSDLPKTLEFWEWFLNELGYRAYQSWEGGESFLLDNTYLVFVQAPEKYNAQTYHRRHPGINHLAFHAASRHDVDEMTEKLQKRNIPILYQDKHPHAGGADQYAVYFEDPNRMKVEFAVQ